MESVSFHTPVTDYQGRAARIKSDVYETRIAPITSNMSNKT